MIRIIHFSDTHAEGETLHRLQNLAKDFSECEVVAHTGDATSNFRNPSSAWNDWPQQAKLSVPGEHGETRDSYSHLTNWIWSTPWHCSVGDLLFLGIDGFSTIRSLIATVPSTAQNSACAIVILAHQLGYRNFGQILSFAEPLAPEIVRFARNRPILFLHGHDHPEDASGSVWDTDFPIGKSVSYRSNVCSSARHNRGRANLITWDGTRFRCESVQGRK